MKRALTWASVASAILIACANDELDFGPLDASSNAIPEAGSADIPDASTPVPDAEASVPAVCGNGKVEQGETCDDGNVVSGDGCASDCKREPSGPGDECPGISITMPTSSDGGARTTTITGSTSSLHPYYSGTCGGSSANDAVYTFVPDADGVLKVTLSANFDSVLHARSACEDAKTELGCDDAPGAAGGEMLLMPLEKGKAVSLFVDGYGTASGDFTMSLEMRGAACGDGIAIAPEVCDDGNNVAGDGCSPTCTFEEQGAPAGCPGQGIFLKGSGNNPRTISIHGDTTDSLVSGQPTSTLNGLAACAGPGPNVVYQFRSDMAGSLEVKLYPEFSGAIVSARSECRTTDLGELTQLACQAPVAGSTGPLTFKVPISTTSATFVIVDSSKDTAKGAYRLEATIAPAVCGNGLLEGTEGCDDGNFTDGDGCTSTCTLEPPASTTDTCPGTPLAFSLVDPNAAIPTYAAVASASTVTLQPNYNGSCAGTLKSRDAVYRVDAPMSGLLTATVSPIGRFAPAVYTQTTCGTQASQTGCSAGQVGVPVSTTVAVTMGQPLYVVVSANSTVSGPDGAFTLRATIAPGTCGNGVLEGGETCDDGNVLPGDGCDATCKLETPIANTCAAAAAIALTEGTAGVFTGNVAYGTTALTNSQAFSPASCPSLGNNAFYTVTAPVDGVLTATATANFAVSIGARADGTCPASSTATAPLTCTRANAGAPATIGIPVSQGKRYYVIVDGQKATDKGPFSLAVKVQGPTCGDGVLSAGEGCDDGNLVSGDGCSATCTLEPIAGVNACPGAPLVLSGMEGPRTGRVTISTAQLGSSQSATCGGSGKEGVFVVTPPISGTLSATLTGLDYSAVLYARSACGNPGSELACSADIPPAVTPAREISIANAIVGTPYYFFVDGYNGASGVAVLQVTVTP